MFDLPNTKEVFKGNDHFSRRLLVTVKKPWVRKRIYKIIIKFLQGSNTFTWLLWVLLVDTKKLQECRYRIDRNEKSTVRFLSRMCGWLQNPQQTVLRSSFQSNVLHCPVLAQTGTRYTFRWWIIFCIGKEKEATFPHEQVPMPFPSSQLSASISKQTFCPKIHDASDWDISFPLKQRYCYKWYVNRKNNLNCWITQLCHDTMSPFPVPNMTSLMEPSTVSPWTRSTVCNC